MAVLPDGVTHHRVWCNRCEERGICDVDDPRWAISRRGDPNGRWTDAAKAVLKTICVNTRRFFRRHEPLWN